MKKSALFIIIAILLLIAAVSVTFFVIIGKTDVNTLEFTLFDKKGANLLAVESNDGKWGFINKKGDEVIKCKYDYVWPFSNGLAAVREGNMWTYINPKGMTAISEKYELAYPFDEKGYAVVMKDGKYGVINKRGDMKIKNEFDGLSAFNEFDVANAQKGDRFGLINRKGEVVAPFKYKNIDYFSEDGYAVVCDENGLYGVIDKTGKEIIPPKYDEVIRLLTLHFGPDNILFVSLSENLINSDLIMIRSKNDSGELLYGYVNKKGEEVIAPEYHKAFFFSENDLAAVCIKDTDGNEKWGYINTDGEFEIEPIFEAALPFKDRTLAAVLLDGKWGLIDKNGEFKVENQYSGVEFSDYDDNPIKVELDGLYGVIDQSGDFLLDLEYKSISFAGDHIIITTVDGQDMLYDHKGEPVNGEIYDKISYLQFGYFRVEKDDQNAVIDSKGNVITEYTDDFTFYMVTKDNYILARAADGRTLILNMDGEEAINMDKYKSIMEYNKIVTLYMPHSWHLN